MRRIFYVIPVAALGAGGFIWWHHTERVAPSPPKHGLLMRDGRIYVPPTPTNNSSGSTPAGSAVAASADTTPAQAGSTSTPSPAGTSTPTTSAGSPAPVVIAPPASGPRQPALTQREQFDEKNSMVGEDRKLAVPIPGADTSRKKIGAVAVCQGPQAEQHYATLTGKQRSDFARACAREGVTLSP